MRIDILTVLPGLLSGPFSESIVKRGVDKGLVEVHVHNLRDWSTNKHKKVDDAPFGTAAGMVLAMQHFFGQRCLPVCGNVTFSCVHGPC